MSEPSDSEGAIIEEIPELLLARMEALAETDGMVSSNEAASIIQDVLDLSTRNMETVTRYTRGVQAHRDLLLDRATHLEAKVRELKSGLS